MYSDFRVDRNCTTTQVKTLNKCINKLKLRMLFNFLRWLVCISTISSLSVKRKSHYKLLSIRL